ncbi:hypothetical protein CEXT_222571 [Caerostris extrusa]|uniref:Uncharacterized protein n=1 Tax=Caerostris extrusa TaxID=172846 RepID=A0AAV4V8D6_CAEEX|nr:hypothetical protein CEXT_222571 [Caerostris extrusa]
MRGFILPTAEMGNMYVSGDRSLGGGRYFLVTRCLEGEMNFPKPAVNVTSGFETELFSTLSTKVTINPRIRHQSY